MTITFSAGPSVTNVVPDGTISFDTGVANAAFPKSETPDLVREALSLLTLLAQTPSANEEKEELRRQDIAEAERLWEEKLALYGLRIELDYVTGEYIAALRHETTGKKSTP